MPKEFLAFFECSEWTIRLRRIRVQLTAVARVSLSGHIMLKEGKFSSLIRAPAKSLSNILNFVLFFPGQAQVKLPRIQTKFQTK